jgi:hypothetical protein
MTVAAGMGGAGALASLLEIESGFPAFLRFGDGTNPWNQRLRLWSGWATLSR